jgi:hypothetical protein
VSRTPPISQAFCGLHDSARVLLSAGHASWSCVAHPPSWVALSFAPSSAIEPLYGLLWWREVDVGALGVTAEMLSQWRVAGADAAVVTKIEPLIGRTYATVKELYGAILGTLSTEEWTALKGILSSGDHPPFYRNFEVGPMRSFSAAGWLGQFLVVAPDKNLVSVRMRRARSTDPCSTSEVDAFPTFTSDVLAIVP